MINFENLDKFAFPGVGKYGIPEIEPTNEYPVGEFIPMDYAMTEKDPSSKMPMKPKPAQRFPEQIFKGSLRTAVPVRSIW